MPHAENKVEWCLRKAEKELQKGDKHRGLRKIKPDLELSKTHLKKAEHNLKAITDFRKVGYSDWSGSAAFYSVYHCLFAIITKFGYESRNQECTFALIFSLIESNKISLDKNLVEEITLLNPDEKHESPTLIEIREESQYGLKLGLEDDSFNRLLQIAKTILDKTKEILAE